MRPHSIENLLNDGTIIARGALDFDIRSQGISPRRLPSWTRTQIPQMMDAMARMPSGVRLQFNTNASSIGLSFLGSTTVAPGAIPRKIVLNLESNGRLQSYQSEKGNRIQLASDGGYRLLRGEPDTAWFRNLGTTERFSEIWLPHNAFVELRSLELTDGATLSPPQDVRKQWLHYGSSISHCMEAEEPAYIWPAVAARNSDVNLQNLGFGGQCHLDQFVARTIRDSQTDLISIKTGINVINMDSMRERVFIPAVHGFIDTIREGKPQTPIIIISPIYCPSAETHPGPTIPNNVGKFETIKGFEALRQGCLTLEKVREILEQVVKKRCEIGDENLHYLDGLKLFGPKDASDLPDDLHPNPSGYIRMGERFSGYLSKHIR